ncbi:MAG: FKBP-type peptidyl-prolyl cis-trans isomerase [Lachnospiraceae bacterium]|nr:FKBP-type peptidyl-prolyl cis-trans isomerase [Lachnospiraceae bacterium]
MNEEFDNNQVETSTAATESVEAPKATLNGVEIDAPEDTPKTGRKAILVIAGVLVLIVAVVIGTIFILTDPADDDDTVASVSTTNEEVTKEADVSTGDSDTGTQTASETESLPAPEYGKFLTEEGFIIGADLTKVTDTGVEALEVPYKAVEYLDDKVTADLLTAAEAYAAYNYDSNLTVEDGSQIILDYKGFMDGVQFEGGTAEHQYLTIGSHTFIDDFEEQLIGSHPEDDVTVTVNFPDPYTNNPDLAGKEAVFECHIVAVYGVPEVDDSFVLSYYSDVADSVESLRAYIKKQGYLENIETYLATYIADNLSVTEVPEEYVENLKSIIRYEDQQSFLQYQTYLMYYGYTDAASMTFEDYTGITSAEYEEYLDKTAREQAALDMTYESMYKEKGLSFNEDYYNMILEYYGGETAVSYYGQPLINQTLMKYTVIRHLVDNANVIDAPAE